MRYWAYLVGKLAVAGAISWGLFAGLRWLWPPQQEFSYTAGAYLSVPARFGHHLGFTLAVGVWFLLSWGLIYFCIRDQRYRCRVCLRPLRMPIGTGSWSSMLQLGRPEIEYICAYGHGRLNVAEVQITGGENPEWTPQADLWEELTAASARDRRDQ